MSSIVTEEDEEILRQQCENASLDDALLPVSKTSQKAILPPIKLGMSFSDWKQMKEAAENNNASKSAIGSKPIIEQRKNQHNNFNKSSFANYPLNQNDNSNFFRTQQNFPNFKAFSQTQNQRNTRNFFQDATIPSIMPPIMPSPSFDDFHQQDQQWSSGPLMQPMFPPMPRIPRLNPHVRTNQSGQHNNRTSSQKRPSTRVKPKSGQSNPITNKVYQKEQPANSTRTANTAEENTITSQGNRTQPQIFIQRPRNGDALKSSWILKPQAPPPMQAHTPEMREEKQRLWREYRQAMKPFKNREFANSKRVVQRLGKKNYEELDEKDRARLDRALEAVNSHKVMLNTRVVQRSARIDQQIKHDKNDISNKSTDNELHPLTSLRPNYTSDHKIWNSSVTQNSTHASRSGMLMTSYMAGGFWTPAPVLTQPRF